MFENKKRKISNFLKTYIISSVLLVIYIYIILNSEFNNINSLNIFLFSIIGVFSFSMLVKEISTCSYSLRMMHWFFCFMFYGIAGFIQYLDDRFVYSLQINNNTLSYVLMIIILWIIFYYLGSKVVCKTNYDKDKGKLTRLLNTEIKYNYSFVVFSTIISTIIVTYVIRKAGISSIFSRATGGIAFKRETIAESLIITILMRNIVVYGLAISIIYNKKYKRGKLLLLIQVFCCFIVNSPLGMARFNVAIVYIGLMLLIFPKFKNSKMFVIVFSLGFILIFPMINVFRHRSLSEISIDVLSETMNNISKNFLHGDYDAFSMIINTKNHIDIYGATYGYQLLGPLLFFVPRSLWANKPLGSGYVVRYAQGESFLNVSSPLIAEGLINFGIIGVILFAYFFGKLTTYIDKIYWKEVENNEFDNTFIKILYPFLLSMVFFVCRGGLMSTYSFSVGHIITYIFMFWLNNVVFS